MTPRRALGLYCVYIAQLMTHTAIYTLPFTLQLCFKPLGILQRVSKSQKVHISSHDRLLPRQKIIFTHILKKSRKIGPVIRPRFRSNSVSNGLSLMLEESRKIGFITK